MSSLDIYVCVCMNTGQIVDFDRNHLKSASTRYSRIASGIIHPESGSTLNLPGGSQSFQQSDRLCRSPKANFQPQVSTLPIFMRPFLWVLRVMSLRVAQFRDANKSVCCQPTASCSPERLETHLFMSGHFGGPKTAVGGCHPNRRQSRSSKSQTLE